MSSSKLERIAFIDIAKAIGIIIVLINHAQLSLGAVTYLGGMFYMPVFFVLAGYTYKYKKSFKVFVIKKAKRLLVPYFVYQLILTGLFGIKDLIAGIISPAGITSPAGYGIVPFVNSLIGVLYSRNSLYPEYVIDNNIYFFKSLNAPLWFLTGLFVSLVLYRIIEEVSIRINKKILNTGVIICIIVGEIISITCPILLPWSIDTAFISVGFIHIGRILRDKHTLERLYKSPAASVCAVILFIALSYINGNVNMSVREYGKSGILYVIIGGLGSLVCVLIAMFIEKYSKHTARFMAMIGENTIGILALHLLVFYAADILFAGLNLPDSLFILEKVVKIVLAVAILLPFQMLLNKLRAVYKRRKAESPNEN